MQWLDSNKFNVSADQGTCASTLPIAFTTAALNVQAISGNRVKVIITYYSMTATTVTIGFQRTDSSSHTGLHPRIFVIGF